MVYGQLFSSNGAGISPFPGLGVPCVLLLQTQARRAHCLRQPPEAQPEDTVGKAVYHTVAKTVTYSQPGRQEGQCWAVQDPGAFQQEVNDIGEPQHVKYASYPKQDHGIATVRAVASLSRGIHLMAREPGPPVMYLFGVLPANFENVEVSEADNKGSRSIK